MKRRLFFILFPVLIFFGYLFSHNLPTNAIETSDFSLERISVPSVDARLLPSGGSAEASFSSDGRFVSFTSIADNFVPNDTNGAYDIFVYDRETNTVERVSIANDGTEGNSSSNVSFISSDGRYVSFDSDASNLVPNDTNGQTDIFVYDRDTNTIERVSVASDGTEGNSYSFASSISADGRYVSFSSFADNLVLGDTNVTSDVFVYDREANTVERVSVADDGTEGDGTSNVSVISGNGRYVTFESIADNFVLNDLNSYDIFVYDRDSNTIERVSVADDGTEGNSNSFTPSISFDGRYVSFQSDSDNLVADDTNGSFDVFVYDRDTNTIERVSVTDDGIGGDSSSSGAYISADGRYVAFESQGTNFVANDTNGQTDVFIYDRDTNTIKRVSVASDETEGNDGSVNPSISADGRYVAFNSNAYNFVIGDTSGSSDIFIRDRNKDITTMIMAPAGSEGNSQSVLSATSSDGRFVSFVSEATNLVTGDTNSQQDVFVFDHNTGVLERVSIASDGTEADDSSESSALSSDGRYVAFDSDAENLIPDDTNGQTDIFVYDRDSNTIERVSIASDGTEGNGASESVSISSDGRYIAFYSDANNLIPDDTNGLTDVFVYDRETNTIERVSIASDGTEGNDESGRRPFISADGRYVAFASDATNLVTGDIGGNPDIFVYDRNTNTIERVSVASDGTEGNSFSSDPSLSGDGRYVTFDSNASNLVPDDTNGVIDIFVYDRDTNTIERVSISDDGVEGNNNSLRPSISSDGRYIAFDSQASTLVSGDTNGVQDVFIYDRNTNNIELVSVANDGTEADGGDSQSSSYVLSSDGSHIAFESDATNLVANDTNGSTDIFLSTLFSVVPTPGDSYNGGTMIALVKTPTSTDIRDCKKGYNFSPTTGAKCPTKITTPTPSTTISITYILKQGSIGQDVKTIQIFLNTILDSKLKVDGIFGKKTTLAVKLFQTKYGLKPDGIVGPKTVAMMNAIGK